MQRAAVAMDPRAGDRIADDRNEADPRACLPAGRIVLVRFALVEVEQPADEERLDSLA